MKLIAIFLLLTIVSSAQEQKPAAAPPISPNARLAAAKTAYMKNGDENDVPFNVIQGGVEGWGRFTLVDSPQKADIIIEVQAPAEDSGVGVSSTTDTGKTKSKATHELSISVVKVLVYDAHTHLMLWTGIQRPKGAFKDKNRMDNLVEASEKLLAQFRDRLEPPTAAPTK